MEPPIQLGASHSIPASGPAVPIRRGSRLGRLFTYSKDTAFSAQENFTTEALGLAILDSAEPMVRALRAISFPGGCPFARDSIASLRPRTQVYIPIPGGGFLDLVLEAFDAHQSLLGEVWVEVKVGAPESGNQLDAYRQEAQRRSRPVWLVTLGPNQLRPDIAHMRWMDLYQAARRTRPEPLAWMDLRKFMEEQMMANDALGPISDREAASLEAAFDFFKKASEVVVGVHRGFDVFPPAVVKKIRWKAEAELLNSAAANFRRTGEFAGGGGALRWGVMSDDGTAYWFLAVRVDSGATDKTDAARRAADHAGLTTSVWERPAVGPTLLARVRATTQGTSTEANEWFRARLNELASSGALAAAQGVTATSGSDGGRLQSNAAPDSGG